MAINGPEAHGTVTLSNSGGFERRKAVPVRVMEYPLKGVPTRKHLPVDHHHRDPEQARAQELAASAGGCTKPL